MPGKTAQDTSYFRVDHDYFANIKVLELSDAAKVLHLTLITYSAAEQRTDGALPVQVCQAERPAAALKELRGSTGYSSSTGKRTTSIHDYLKHQTPAQVISQARPRRGAHVQVARAESGTKSLTPDCPYCQESQLNSRPLDPRHGRPTVPF